MELDRQSIEKRDFPIGRRGYDPAAVDAHLRALAAEVEELRRSLSNRGAESLGSTAGTQVRSILEAAETTAAEIERQATEDARRAREDADRDAERTRSDAVRRAQGHVEAVSRATAILLERVESMDSEVGSLVDSLRAGASRLATDLASMETNMGELYDAASGGEIHDTLPAAAPAPPALDAARTPAAATVVPPAPVAPSNPIAPAPRSSGSQVPPVPSHPAGGNGDLDGARLIALNMALNGESRAQADRYLADNFQLADRAKLLDEVYAAIEG